jgi:hypothetical protein
MALCLVKQTYTLIHPLNHILWLILLNFCAQCFCNVSNCWEQIFYVVTFLFDRVTFHIDPTTIDGGGEMSSPELSAVNNGTKRGKPTLITMFSLISVKTVVYSVTRDTLLPQCIRTTKR